MLYRMTLGSKGHAFHACMKKHKNIKHIKLLKPFLNVPGLGRISMQMHDVGDVLKKLQEVGREIHICFLWQEVYIPGDPASQPATP